MTAIKKTIAEMKAEQNRLFIERNGLRDKHNSFLEVMLLLSIGAALAIVTAVFGYTHRMWKLRREAEEAAAHLAHHDSLTGLPNRRLLRDRIAIQTAQARRQKSLLAILYLDLDGFKQINDRLGHQAGDDLLRQVAERLKPLLRSEDTVARLGGDEFVVSLAGLEDAKYSAIIAERAIKAVGAPYSISGHSATVGVSVGIALYPLHGEDEASLLKRADDALYTAKLAGKGRYAMAPTQPSSEEKPAIPVGALAAH